MPQPITTNHHSPPPDTSQNISTTTRYHTPPCITTHHQPKYIHHYLPLPKKMKHHPASIFIYNLPLTFLKQFLFLRNTILLSVTEILCDKVLISSFFKFQSSTAFRSSHKCSVRIGILRNFAKFTEKYLCQA